MLLNYILTATATDEFVNKKATHVLYTAEGCYWPGRRSMQRVKPAIGDTTHNDTTIATSYHTGTTSVIIGQH